MLRRVLGKVVEHGRLTVIHGDGRETTYGDGSGPPVKVRLTKRAERRLLLNPGLAIGETYMDGELELIEGSYWDLIEALTARKTVARAGLLMRQVHRVLRRWRQWNDRDASRRNVAHHYDLSGELYRRFLDADMQYSCAYFAEPGMDLDEAQAAKKAHLAAKLRLDEGLSVLDIGCGWGGLGLELAGRHGARVTGITLSQEQLAVAQARARDAGLGERARFELLDYRDAAGPFDRIISVGMLEHVGAPNLAGYFRKVAELMAPDGMAVIHAIGSHDPPGVTQPFIRKYIFPGGYIPSLSQVTAAVEDAGLWITDIEVLRLHYAETLKHWRARFLARRDEIKALYDERFCRMWEVYLCMSEAGFRHLNCMVFQIQLAKKVGTVPITRDYIYETEHEPEQQRRRA